MKKYKLGETLPDVNMDDGYSDDITCRTCDGEGKDVDVDDEIGAYTIKCGTCKGTGMVACDHYVDEDGDTDYGEDYRDE